jgi:16S rRNA (cytosine967-C5)-methyltransferase
LELRLAKLTDSRDLSLSREIAYGVLRFLPRLRFAAIRLLQYPLKSRDLDVECLLLAGIYQLLYLRVPAHAAVSETVAAVRVLGKPWAGGLLNGVLRNFERRKPQLLEAMGQDRAAQLCFPEWLLARLRRSWPEDWARVAEQSNLRPPMMLRVNKARLSRRVYARQLAEAGLTVRPLPNASSGLQLDRPVVVAALPGFDDGLVSVQDGAAQLAAPLLQLEAGQQVLDACAAPGGKTAQVLELQPGVALTAVDISPERLRLLRDNLARLRVHARVLAADVTDATEPWADRHYERILLDAPCSATGVIRRHPDIKWLRRDQDIACLISLQSQILDAVWSRLAPGGILVYATCSLLAEENHEQMRSFLQRTPEARELPIEAQWGRACTHGRQILTGDGGMDGFYFARLAKVAGSVPT